MSYTISPLSTVQETIDNADEHLIGVEFDISDYFSELKDGDVYVRVYADKDDFDGGKFIVDKFYMTAKHAKQLTQP